MRPDVLLDKVTQDVRDYAATLNDPDHQGLTAAGGQLPSSLQNGSVAGADAAVAEAGMKEMSEKFKAMGSEVYVEADAVKESNKAL